MAAIISVHSFRGGTGKSNATANLAAVLASRGQRVGVIDTDIQSPGIHILFGLAGDEVAASLNDYLWHGRDIQDVALDVTPGLGAEVPGKVFLVASNMQPGEITRVLREGYDAQKLTTGLRNLVTSLSLDTLIIDTHPGLNEETLLSLVISNALIIVMRPEPRNACWRSSGSRTPRRARCWTRSKPAWTRTWPGPVCPMTCLYWPSGGCRHERSGRPHLGGGRQ